MLDRQHTASSPRYSSVARMITADKPHPFDYQKPTMVQQGVMNAISERLREAYDRIIEDVAPSAERTLAIRKLQEARMWINVAILGITL